MSKVEERLAAAGIAVPSPVAPIANYVPFVRTGSQVYISGQVSLDGSGGITGTVGTDVDMETAVKAARLCGINLIAQMKAACDGDLDRVARVDRILVVEGASPAARFSNGTLQLTIQPNLGPAGRPSSERIVRAISG